MTNAVVTIDATFEELRNLKPEELVSQLHKVFGLITQMHPDQVIAVYQVLATIESVAPQKEAREVARHLKQAAASQMNNLVIQNPFTHSRVRLKARFLQIGVRILATDSPY